MIAVTRTRVLAMKKRRHEKTRTRPKEWPGLSDWKWEVMRLIPGL